MSNIFEIDDEIIEIEYIGEQDTIDINVSGNRLFYANDILTHNSAVDEAEQTQAMIGGGISKIQRADNVIAIYQSASMKERGEFVCTFLKTRSSAGVNSKVYLHFDVDSMRITDHEEGYINEDVNIKSDGTELRDKIKNTSNSDMIKAIKKGPVKSNVPDHDPETGEIIEDKKPIESHTERLARLKDKGLI